MESARSDTKWGRNAGAYYTADALFEGPIEIPGRANREFYRWRETSGSVWPCMPSATSARLRRRRARALQLVPLLLRDGETILPTHPPITISMVTDKVQCGRRALAYSGRSSHVVTGGTPPTNQRCRGPLNVAS